MNAITHAISITRPARGEHIFRVTGRAGLVIRAGTTVMIDAAATAFGEDTDIDMPELVAGTDYAVVIDEGRAIAVDASIGVPATAIGGFHFAPGGNAPEREGGDDIPAINQHSCWDAGFRPSCADPRGMVLARILDGRASWIDIYKLGVEHAGQGTSRHGVTIANGRDLPGKAGGGKYSKLDYATAVAILAHHGKQLLDFDEFRAAAIGVTEKTAADSRPKTTGLDEARTSRFGLMQATGNLRDWGTDGDPDNPRASIFGGSWFYGGDSGSRYAGLGSWPGDSYDDVGARGRCDHHES